VEHCADYLLRAKRRGDIELERKGALFLERWIHNYFSSEMKDGQERKETLTMNGKRGDPNLEMDEKRKDVYVVLGKLFTFSFTID